MKLIKMLGATLLSFAALVSVGANAQTQNIPVSCSWNTTGSQSHPTGVITYQECKEYAGSASSIAATRVFTYTRGKPIECTINLSAGVYNSGTCESTSLYRVATPVCKNSGTLIASGCANSMTSSAGFGAEVVRLCGASSCVTYQNLGGINGCWTQSPYLKAYCK